MAKKKDGIVAVCSFAIGWEVKAHNEKTSAKSRNTGNSKKYKGGGVNFASLRARSFPPCLFGFAFYSSWSTVFFYGLTFAPATGGDLQQTQTLRLVYMLVLAITLSAVAMASRQAVFTSHPRAKLTIAGICMSAGTAVCALAAGNADLSYPFVIIGSTIAACGTAIIIPFFGESFCTLGPKPTSICMLLALLLSVFMSFVARRIAPPFGLLLGMAMPLLMVFFVERAFLQAKFEADGPSIEHSSGGLSFSGKLMLIAAVSGFLGVIVRSTASFSGIALGDSLPVESVTRAIGFALLLLVILAFGRGFDSNSVFRPTVPAIISVCLILPFIGETHTAMSAALFSVSHFYLYVFNWTLYSDLSSRLKIPASFLFCLGKAFDSVGCAVGVVAGYALAMRVGDSLHFWNIVSVVCAYCILLVSFFILFDRDINDKPAASGSPASENPLSVCCREASEAYGLSPRESEVLLLLLEGRSVPYVAKSLYVSLSTAKTHARSIYKKTGVHSRQELLDLVCGNPSGKD